MAQDIVNENQKISYTNLDFSSIYTEVIDLIKQLTYRWDPSISDESDPGVVLVKLSSLIADKCNYNIDKNILETFPLSVTQNGNARQLYDQLGYYMNWYESASVPVLLSWVGETNDSSVSYTIPKFTAITDSESSHIYSLIGAEGTDGVIVSDTILPADGNAVTVIAMEGTPVQYQFENETVITTQMVDPISRRLYFPHSYVSQNGVFIKNTNQENYASWKRVNNLYENSYNELRYVFGYDSNTDTCFLEFPDNYSELFGSGIEITYLVVPQETINIPAQALNSFLAPIAVGGDAGIVLDSSNVKIVNYVAASGHKDIESINDAYINYKRTVGTFKTLITLRDYLNYIRSQELDICSNAFVCDRTNDIQSTYKIMSSNHDLDTIIVKVEQLLDKTTLESTFDYKFVKTSDININPLKTYYTISNNNTLSEVTTPVLNDLSTYYELSSVEPKYVDALSPFSLKFYLLRKAIALNSKTAYNQTFSMMKTYPEFDSLLEGTSHLEHTYEDILPLGENTYIKSNDDMWYDNKSYWLYDSEEDIYELISDTSVFDGTPASLSNVYNIDVEALLPHTVMFKGVYPVTLNISTYNVLDEDTQADISSSIISSLYSNVNSSQVGFGLPISIDYLVEIAKNSDDRIKNVTIDPVEYSLFATYYDKNENMYIDVELNSDMDSLTPISQRSISDIISALMKKDIICKSILAGTTQLLVPDDTFIYHLSQKYLDYIDGISNITGEAIIDVQNDSVTSYSLDNENSFIRKAYTLKDNEVVSIYRPKFNATKTFPNNVHFEYVLYNDIPADSSYKLNSNEYFILYNPIKDDDATTIIGYTVYACSAGAIIHSTFDITKQTSLSALSGFARARVVTYFSVNPTKNYYELSTYNENYKTEIRNSSAIINNAISGTNEIQIQEVSTITLDREDKYKFFWILNEPTYSNNSNLKSYTLFDNFDSVNDNNSSEVINTYTLRNGEALFYTNESATDFAMLGPGTTLIRNCGVESSIYTEIENSIYYVAVDDISHILLDGDFSWLTDENNQIRPFANGLYEVSSAELQTLGSDDNPLAKNLYEQVIHDDTTISYIPTFNTEPQDGVDYYKLTFIRTLDTALVSGKYYYVLVMRKEAGWYIKSTVTDDNGVDREIYVSDEIETGCFKEVNLYTSAELYNPKELGLYEILTSGTGTKFIDQYALNDNVAATKQNRYTSTEDTSIINRNILADTKYSGINLIDISTYTTIDMSEMITSSPETLGLLTPIYKKYYTTASHTEEVPVSYLSNPNAEGLWAYEYNSITGTYEYMLTSDTTPKVESVNKSLSVELLKEKDTLFTNNLNNSGYYYKPSSINSTYYYNNNLGSKLPTTVYSNISGYSPSFLDAGTVLTEYEGSYNRSPLSYLFYWFSNTSAQTDSSLEESTKRLSQIAANWATAISYQKPYMEVPLWDSNSIYKYDDVVAYSPSSEQPALSYKCIVSQASSTWNYDEWVRVDTSWATFKFKTHTDPHTIPSDDSNSYLISSIRDASAIPEWSSDETYEYGAVVLYTIDANTNAYMCIVDQASSTWDSEEWKEIDTSTDNKYIKVAGNTIIDKSIIIGNIYPILDEGPDSTGTNAWFFIPAAFLNNFADADLVDPINYYILDVDTSVTPNVPSFIYLDNDLKLSRLFPNSKNGVSNYGIVHIFFIPKLYEFNDFVRYTYKNYYEPKVLYNRNCGEIKAWTCTALDNDYIYKDPIKNIGDLWTSLQTNTSLTLIENEIQSFSSGDTLIFEADETSEAYVSWPVFSNTETVLDLDSYKVSYQRVGEDIKDIETVAVDDYKWRGYSSLMLNTSSTSGQKLEYNHTLKLYDSDVAEEPIATLDGSSHNNITFQLKYPVENKIGTFIDVSTVDMLGEDILNKLYAFTPFTNGSYYAYDTSNYKTYLYFNQDENEGSNPTTYSPSTIDLPIGLPSGNYLLGMNMKDDINLTINMINMLEGISSGGSGVNGYIDYPAIASNIAYGDMKYTFDTNYNTYLHSYVDTSRTVFTGDKYDYIYLSISSEYNKIKLPSLVSYLFGKSPYALGWYIKLDNDYIKCDSSYTSVGPSLLEAIPFNEDTRSLSPVEEGWYEYILDNGYWFYELSTDAVMADANTKTYYKEPDLYVSISDVNSYLRFTIDDNKAPRTYTILDVFKYNQNPAFGSEFDTVLEKIKALDTDEQFNYMFKPSANDLIENPLDPKSFWNSNHVYNSFIIPQLNFDELNCRYITTKMNR